MAPLVRTGGSRHTGLAAPPHRNIQYLHHLLSVTGGYIHHKDTAQELLPGYALSCCLPFSMTLDNCSPECTDTVSLCLSGHAGWSFCHLHHRCMAAATCETVIQHVIFLTLSRTDYNIVCTSKINITIGNCKMCIKNGTSCTDLTMQHKSLSLHCSS